MIVARLRGVEFHKTSRGFWLLNIATNKADEALDDVAEWLGFENRWEYLKALEVGGEKILTRGA